MIYQAGFVGHEDGRLCLYDRKTQRYSRAHPKNTCFERELYTIDPHGRQDRRIESEWLSRIDGEGATAVRQFKEGAVLSREWTESFSIFIALLIARSPVFRDLTKRNAQMVGEEILRLGFTDVERARQMMERYGDGAGANSEDVTPEGLVEAVTGGHIQVQATERPFLTMMIRQVEFLARLIGSFGWRIVKAPAGTGFILSDYPFVVVPPATNPNSIGLGIPGTVKYFPLTKGLCLRMGDPDCEFSYANGTKEYVRLINQNIAVNSERFIMGPSRTQLEHIIARSNTVEPAPSPRVVVEAVRTDQSGALYRLSFWPTGRTFFYPP